ncbi:MAG TPA: DUF2203 domain-containing protein [Solirubrobacteraceae bacterium]|jgi:hypothetical protein|nr:DUF2203 domain-containing protein [Solirubrobacteraceae bacterium]
MTDEPLGDETPDDLRHDRHYTLEQAMAVRGWVAQRVGWVRDAQARLMSMGPAATDAIDALDSDSGGAYPGREVARGLVEISRAVGELDAVDIVLRDVDRGLIDFPAMRDGVEVYLCWLVDDEDSIGFWHEPEAGFGGRRPL